MMYAGIIKRYATEKFRNLEVLQDKIEPAAYYQKLTEIGWAIINVKVQQGLGNIIALIWMGVKLFLDKNTSTYKDFKDWGIIIFSIQDNLIEEELTSKLSETEKNNNRARILQRFSEDLVNDYWKKIVN